MFDSPAHLGQYALLAAMLFVATIVISLAVALAVILRLPPVYFCAPRARNAQRSDHGLFLPVGIVLRNLFGAILIVLGIILSVPGLPGQGLLTVVAGLFLVDFPGKRNLLYKLASRPLLLQSINWLRTKFLRPPLVVGTVAGPRET